MIARLWRKISRQKRYREASFQENIAGPCSSKTATVLKIEVSKLMTRKTNAQRQWKKKTVRKSFQSFKQPES